MDFPIVALESAQAADDLDGALRLIGFAAVVGHGVGDDVIEAAWSAGERFFALPLAAKLAVHVPGRPYG